MTSRSQGGGRGLDRRGAPVLVIGWGNTARADDGLGVRFVERLAERAGAQPVDWLLDDQLQVEHALEIAGRERVLFVDASRSAAAPFEARPVEAARDPSYTTHALSPAALLQVLVDIGEGCPPPAMVLAIRGERFELGEPMGAQASENLEAALAWGAAWLRDPG